MLETNPEDDPDDVTTVDVQAFGARLEEVFVAKASRREVGAGFVFDAELNLDEELENFCIDRYLAANPATLEPLVSAPKLEHEALRQQLKEKLQAEILALYDAIHDERTTTLVFFDWSSSAPVSWDAQLELLDFGGARGYVCWSKKEEIDQPWTAIAAVEPKDDAEVMSAIFTMPSGRDHWLPTGISNNFPKLIRRHRVRDTVAAQLEYFEGLEDFLAKYGDPDVTEPRQQLEAALENYMEEAYSEEE
jgi:hypothetical protein